ncbi:disease resistance protein RGA2-like [Momordica charantia]|uniref:Disease resistance protein RGA2-like n=1 Tax=Momordica charantia TaxID=3673 RepID=A0A6J1D340_MOMCH|nr:disease resistance protein RGA2-like [Momordica charantia]
MAESLWTCVVEKVLEKIASVVAEQIGVATGFNNALEELHKNLVEAENIINATTKKTSHDDLLRKGVNDLQLTVDEANDVLDLIVYEDLRKKVKSQTKWKVPFSFCTSKYSPAFRLKRAKEIKEILGMLSEHMDKLPKLASLGDNTTETEIDMNQLRETDSKIDDFDIVGRDVELSSIVDRVIDATNRHVTSILPIVGVGGLGKTTLAKLVINHERIKHHFNNNTIWVCVSQPFNVNKILGTILETLKDTPSGLEYKKEVLLGQLYKEMRGKKYFLVLDDVWNENRLLWDELKNCLMKITENSENGILVTTRSAEVAKIMETLPSHHLGKLSDDQCWSLFQESANANGLSMTSSLKVVREELVKKIGGLPLIAKVWGSAEQYLGDPDKWVINLKSLVCNSLQNENSATSALKLSVDRLPRHSLKQCFAYCSNFPKDFEFTKEQLIQMWIAQGFIHLPKGRSNETIEDEGDRHFKILLRRCLFQDVVQDDRGIIVSCKMHDLIHDIACDVSNDHKLQYSNNSLDGEVWTDENKKIASKLRTIIYCEDQMMPPIMEKVIHDKVMNFVCLRVLKMNSRSISELPDSIGELKHLRYLDISGCSITQLPKSIALLYNLQTLNMGGLLIKDLPKNIIDLVNLKHLQFYPYHFDTYKMPAYFGKLTQLQTLSYFVVGFENGHKISELGLLKNLKGSLNLCFLEKVESKEEARAAKLVEKENLDELEFEWSQSHLRKDNDSYKDFEILEGLQPHKNLRSLSIERSAIKSLPNNIFVENLAVISLRDCQNCERLPMLGQLRNLERLEVYGLHSVQSISNEFYGNDCNQRTLFPKLRAFLLSDMENLEQWKEVTVASNLTTFPCLESLNIWRCPKLMNIPDVFGYCDENGVEHLRHVTISGCDGLNKLPNGLQFCHSIEDLTIEDCSNLTLSLQNKNRLSSLSIGGLHKLPEGMAHLKKLEAMKINGGIQDYDFSPLMHLPSLTYLHLCDDLGTATHVPRQVEHCTTLKFLIIENFEHIEALPEWFGNFTSLKRLGLYFCSNLKQLPSREAMLRLTELRALYVDRCPQLQLDEGDTERAKLSHLPEIDVRFGYRVYKL